MRRVWLWLMCLIGVALLGVQLGGPVPISDVVLAAVAFGMYAFIAGLIVFRRDGHPTGWLLLLIGVLLLFADSALYFPGATDAFGEWVDGWVWTTIFAVFAVLTLTFPSGHLPDGPGLGARLGRLAGRALPVLVAVAMFSVVPADSGFVALDGLQPWLGYVGYSMMFIVVLILLGGVVSLVLKRRNATGAERAQITWVVFGSVVLITALVVTFAVIAVSETSVADADGDVKWVPAWLLMVTFPLWFGIAILRYRLFDIDRIISRTVSYSLVVALLAAVFGLVVTVSTTLVPTGNDLHVAISTLVVAALFDPVRRTVLRVVDRRFNRSHYDAVRVGMEFARTVQDELDEDRIIQGWLGVLDATVQPTSLSVWIRDRPEDLPATSP